MIIDTLKTNCLNCQYYKPYKPPKQTIDILETPGPLFACNGVNGFGIVGPTFYCTNHTKTKG